MIKMKNENLKKVLENGFYTNKRQYNRTKKILKMIDDEKINQDNYWDEIRKLCKNVTSCRGISEWQGTSEYIYSNVFEK